MLTWIKKILGVAPAETKQEPLVLENPVVEAETKPAKPKKAPAAKTTTTKKAPAAKTTEAPKKRGRKPKAES
jgi:hypothetical protein